MGTARIEFTSMIFGDGVYNSSEDLRLVTEIRGRRQEVGLNSIRALDDESVLLTTLLSNEELEEGYQVRAIGLMARDKENPEKEPVLYSIVTQAIGPDGEERGDFLPTFNGKMPNIINQQFIATVSNSAEVTIVSGGVYASADDLEYVLARLRDHRHRAETVDESTGETTEEVQRRQDRSIAGIKKKIGSNLDKFAAHIADKENPHKVGAHQTLESTGNPVEFEQRRQDEELDTLRETITSLEEQVATLAPKELVATFTASGVFNPANFPEFDLTEIDVFMVGGGGGAAASTTTVNGVGGAGGGTVFAQNVKITQDSYNIVIGAGGVGGSTSANMIITTPTGGGNTSAFGLTTSPATGGPGGRGQIHLGIQAGNPLGGDGRMGQGRRDGTSRAQNPHNGVFYGNGGGGHPWGSGAGSGEGAGGAAGAGNNSNGGNGGVGAGGGAGGIQSSNAPAVTRGGNGGNGIVFIYARRRSVT